MYKTLSVMTTAAALFSNAALASPSYIKGAEVEEGELELEYQLVNSFDDNKKKDHKRKHKFDAYYGLSDQWLIGGGFKLTRASKDETDLTDVFVEAAYQFIDESDYGFNMGILGEYVHSLEGGSPDKLEAKLLFDKEWGKFKTKANLIVEREIGENHGHSVELASRLGTVYKVNKHFKPGLEWHGEYGHLNDIGSVDDEQKHYVGPIVHGDLFELANHGGELEYQIGYLFGVSDPTEDGTLRFLLEYKVEF